MQVLQRRSLPGVINLSSLHRDPYLIEHDIFAVLSDKDIFKQVMVLVKQTFPNVQGLDLSHNYLTTSHLHILSNVFEGTSLESVNLEYNSLTGKISNLGYALKKLPLKELKVTNNNFHLANEDELVNLQDVRKSFPSLETLDGQTIDQRIQELITGKTNVLHSFTR